MPSPTPKTRLTDPVLALPEHWYVLTPAGRVGDSPKSVVIGGRTVAVWRDQGHLHTDAADLPLAEQDGYVWAWLGIGQPAAVPSLPPLRRSNLHWSCGSVDFPASFVDSLENTLDLVHPAFAHPATHPTWLFHRLGWHPDLRVVVTPDAQGWVGEGFLAGRRVLQHSFRLPDRAYLVTLPQTPLESHTYAHHVPLGPDRCRFEFLFGRRRLPWERTGPHDTGAGWPLHEQDRLILQGLSRNRRRYPTLGEQHAAADAYTLFFRKVIHLVQIGEWQDVWPTFPEFEVSVRL